MFHIHAEHALNAPQPVVWDVMNDFGSHYRYNPFVQNSEITNDIHTGLGAERSLQLYDGSTMRQRIVSYEAGRSMVIDVVESELLIRHFIIELSVEGQTADTCKLIYDISYAAPFGIVGYPFGLLFKPILISRVNHVLKGVERYVTTREPQTDIIPLR